MNLRDALKPLEPLIEFIAKDTSLDKDEAVMVLGHFVFENSGVRGVIPTFGAWRQLLRAIRERDEEAQGAEGAGR